MCPLLFIVLSSSSLTRGIPPPTIPLLPRLGSSQEVPWPSLAKYVHKSGLKHQNHHHDCAKSPSLYSFHFDFRGLQFKTEFLLRRKSKDFCLMLVGLVCLLICLFVCLLICLSALDFAYISVHNQVF